MKGEGSKGSKPNGTSSTIAPTVDGTNREKSGDRETNQEEINSGLNVSRNAEP